MCVYERKREEGSDQAKASEQARGDDSEERPERACMAGSWLAAWGCVS